MWEAIVNIRKQRNMFRIHPMLTNKNAIIKTSNQIEKTDTFACRHAILCRWNHNFDSSWTFLVLKLSFALHFRLFFNSTLRTLTSSGHFLLFTKILREFCKPCATACRSVQRKSACVCGSRRCTQGNSEKETENDKRCGYLTPGPNFLGCAKN